MMLRETEATLPFYQDWPDCRFALNFALIVGLQSFKL
jgi:hypothetical protein